MIEMIGTADFKEKVIDSPVPVLVDFFAAWCGPCRMMLPTLELLAEDMGDNIRIYKMDIDEDSAVATALGVISVPTFVAFKNGKPMNRVVGAVAEKELMALFD